MVYAAAILALLLGGCAHRVTDPGTVATVEGQPIYRADVLDLRTRLSAAGTPVSEREALDRLVSLKLAAHEARRRGLHETREVQRAQDTALYRQLLSQLTQDASQALDASPEELQAAYTAQPLIRLRHLVLVADDETTRARAQRTLGILKRKIRAGVPFKKLAIAYSDDPSVQLNGGDLDYRSPQNLARSFYEIGLKLSRGQVSDPHWEEGAYHLFERLGELPFDQAPVTYVNSLAARIRFDREEAFLRTTLGELRETAEVQVLEQAP